MFLPVLLSLAALTAADHETKMKILREEKEPIPPEQQQTAELSVIPFYKQAYNPFASSVYSGYPRDRNFYEYGQKYESQKYGGYPFYPHYPKTYPSFPYHQKNYMSYPYYPKSYPSYPYFPKSYPSYPYFPKSYPSYPYYQKDFASYPYYQKDFASFPYYKKDYPSFPYYQKDDVTLPYYKKDYPSFPYYQKDDVTLPYYKKDFASFPYYQKKDIAYPHFEKNYAPYPYYQKDDTAFPYYQKDYPSYPYYQKDYPSYPYYQKDYPSYPYYQKDYPSYPYYQKDYPSFPYYQKDDKSYPYYPKNFASYPYENNYFMKYFNRFQPREYYEPKDFKNTYGFQDYDYQDYFQYPRKFDAETEFPYVKPYSPSYYPQFIHKYYGKNLDLGEVKPFTNHGQFWDSDYVRGYYGRKLSEEGVLPLGEEKPAPGQVLTGEYYKPVISRTLASEPVQVPVKDLDVEHVKTFVPKNIGVVVTPEGGM